MKIETLFAFTLIAAGGTAGVVASPQAAFDYQGVAILLGAITVFITGIVTSILTILTFNRQGARDRLAQETHDLVDGVSSKLEAATTKAAFAEGKEVGADKERAIAAAVTVSVQPVKIEEVAPAVVEAISGTPLPKKQK